MALAHDATNHDILSRLQFERQKKEREYKKKQEALTLEETKEQIAQVTWLHQIENIIRRQLLSHKNISFCLIKNNFWMV